MRNGVICLMRDALPPPFTLNALAFMVFFFKGVPGVTQQCREQARHHFHLGWERNQSLKLILIFSSSASRKVKIPLAFPLLTQVDK